MDECTGPAVARWLSEERGCEVFSVFDEIIEKAFAENWILITNDKDFGEKVFKEHHPNRGVVFLRLGDERSSNKIRVVQRLLEHHAENLPDRFVVVTESLVRFSGSI